jgi:hypothetical protein
MRKLLLGTAAVALGMSFAVSEAQAQVKLDVGGYTKLYGVWLDQDEATDDLTTPANESREVRSFDMHRDTEIHFSGETTLDNGLTVGFHTETHADGNTSFHNDDANGFSDHNTAPIGNNDSFDVEESYAYFSGAWGRVNVGAEDGAAYLLQVAAPSADSNYDGLRQYINVINHANIATPGLLAGENGDAIRLSDIFGGGAGSAFAAALTGVVFDAGAAGVAGNNIEFGANAGSWVAGAVSGRLDYDNAATGNENKLTYMTPVFNGLQGGLSFTPEMGSAINNGITDGVLPQGNNLDDTANDYGEAYEAGIRYEGVLGEIGMALGGGYTHIELERSVDAGAGGCADAVFFVDADASGGCTDASEVTARGEDRDVWNVGADFDWRAFGFGAIYTEDDHGVSGDALMTETWVVGADYTTGPFKIGASYLDSSQDFGGAELDRERWTGGVVYTYGPGMTFRGSVSYIDLEENLGQRLNDATSGSSSADATSLLLGTQIDF